MCNRKSPISDKFRNYHFRIFTKIGNPLITIQNEVIHPEERIEVVKNGAFVKLSAKNDMHSLKSDICKISDIKLPHYRKLITRG